MVAIPVLKIFSFTIKTLAKPVAKRIKSEAERHPVLRGVLHTMGQTTNNLSLRISIRMAGHTTKKIKPLDEGKAIADGGDLLAEGFIYALGAGLLVWEYMSSALDKEHKDAMSKKKKQDEERELAEALEMINQRLEALEEAVVAAAAKAEAANVFGRTPAPRQPSTSPASDRLAESNGRGGQASPPSRWRWPSFLGGGEESPSESPSGTGAAQGGENPGSAPEKDSVENGSTVLTGTRDRSAEGSEDEAARDKGGWDDRGSFSSTIDGRR